MRTRARVTGQSENAELTNRRTRRGTRCGAGAETGKAGLEEFTPRPHRAVTSLLRTSMLAGKLQGRVSNGTPSTGVYGYMPWMKDDEFVHAIGHKCSGNNGKCNEEHCAWRNVKIVGRAHRNGIFVQW